MLDEPSMSKSPVADRLPLELIWLEAVIALANVAFPVAVIVLSNVAFPAMLDEPSMFKSPVADRLPLELIWLEAVITLVDIAFPVIFPSTVKFVKVAWDEDIPLEAVIWFTYNWFHLLDTEPKSYVLLTSGIILLLISELNTKESVDESPIVILPVADKDPDIVTVSPELGVMVLTYNVLIFVGFN